MDHHLLQNTILLAIAALDCTIALWVWTRNPKHPAHWTFLVFVAGAGMWTVGKVFLTITHMFVFGEITLLGGIITLGGFTLLCDVFPSKQRVEKTFWLSLIPLLAVAILIPTRIFISATAVLPNGATKPINGPAFPIFAAIFSGYILYTLYIFFRRYRRMKGIARLQMQYVLLGVSSMLIVGLISDVLLPAFDIFSLNFLGPASSGLVVIATAYAIARHQLLDIKVVILRGTIYSVLATLIIGLYLGTTLVLIDFGLQNRGQTASLLSAGFTLLVGIFGTPRLERYFRKVTDRIFFKDRYDYASAVHALSQSLNRNLDLEVLMRESAEALQKIFKVSWLAIVTIEPWQVFRGGSPIQTSGSFSVKELTEAIKEQPQVLLKETLEKSAEDVAGSERKIKNAELLLKIFSDYGYEVMIKFLTPKKLVGVLGMSAKRSGDRYTPEDIQLLKTFSHQAAVAIEKSLLYGQTRDYAQNLEDNVRLRTEEFRKLQEGQKQMMENISHGLQTPLTILKNELAEFSSPDALHSANREIIERSIDNISSLIYRLLRLSRLETLSGLSEKRDLDLSEMISEVVEYAEVVCEQKDIQLKKDIKSEVFIKGDQEQLKELAQNLIANAMRYTENSPKKIIKVGLNKTPDTISFHVSDTGMGIDAEDLPRIFERFYRPERSKKENKEGMGLGLAICRQIAKNHGGKIRVESSPGNGATFIVEFKTEGLGD